MIGKTFRFCPVCATPLVEKHIEPEDKVRSVCPSCDFIHYRNPTPAAGVVLMDGSRILMVKRKYPPRVGMWTLPAGFVETGEDVAECAVRETKEETGLDVDIVRLFNVYTAMDDPRAAVVLIIYVGRQTGGALQCGDDASDARFFGLDVLPPDIAFTAHKHALTDIKAEFAQGDL